MGCADFVHCIFCLHLFVYLYVKPFCLRLFVYLNVALCVYVAPHCVPPPCAVATADANAANNIVKVIYAQKLEK